MIDRADTALVEGAQLHDASGALIGVAHRVYVDHDSGRPEWAVVEVLGSERFVPLFPATLEPDGVRVPVDGALVASAPPFDPDAGHLSEADETALYDHYGLLADVPLSPGGPVPGEPTATTGAGSLGGATAGADTYAAGGTDAPEADGFVRVPGGPDPSVPDGLSDRDRIQVQTDIEAAEGTLDDDGRSERQGARERMAQGERREQHEGLQPGPSVTDVAR